MSDTEQRLWTVELPSYGPPISSNRRNVSRWAEQRNAKQWRSAANAALRAHRPMISPLDHAYVELTLIPPDRRRRDAMNYVHYVLKPVVDALTDQGIIRDDADEWVTWRIVIAEWPTHTGVWRYQLTISDSPILSRHERVINGLES
jgi:Holliday junction resolvase RusA-like endonuclease